MFYCIPIKYGGVIVFEEHAVYTPCPGKNGPPKQNAVKCTVYNTIQ